MKHTNAYVAQLIVLYQLALAEYIRAKKDTLDEIQAKMKDTVLRNAIVWSNTSLQDVPNAIKQNAASHSNAARSVGRWRQRLCIIRYKESALMTLVNKASC
ncbi:hypothetical protein [Lactobacillus gallinarum]|uniref:hypothetical protein n=1 Tax=Lactobacillus gallinarum TaxID=52242 RepID=UPI003890262D